tara:strand:- start:78 stop:497 length:420 start_codon:yes stop_codon:yes gene_type:complete
MVRDNIIKYIGVPHSYSGINCLTIIHDFYKNELNIDCIADLIPEDIDDAGRRWVSKITLPQIEEWALIHGTKVNLTDAQDFDVIVFKSPKYERPIHFGMFLKPCHMLHLEEGRTSRYETITTEWANCFHAIYRHHSLVQ